MTEAVIQKYVNNGLYMVHQPIQATLLRPDAEEPFKENHTDVGYILTIVGRMENRVEDSYLDVNVFTTGLHLKAPPRFHLEIIPHPQLYKTGYIFADGVRVVESGEEVMIPLFKYRETADIELPFKAAVVILRESEHTTISKIERRAPAGYNGYEEEFPRRVMDKKKSNRKGSHMF